MAITITADNFDAEINKSSKPVVIDIYATWCGPCQQMAPIFDSLEKELGTNYTFAKLNVDQARNISINFGVTSVPTFLFIKNGEVKGRETGFMSKETLTKKITQYLG